MKPFWDGFSKDFGSDTPFDHWEFGNIEELFDLSGPSISKAETITSPVAIDLDGDGIETTSLENGVYFDHDGNGLAEKTGWIAADDGLLVMDRNGDAVIDAGAELFGNNTQLADGSTAANGFEALAELDQNSDGVIDQLDGAYQDLRIWRDLNQDGQSQADELLTLQEAGVSSISTQYSATSQTDAQGNKLLQSGSATLADGTQAQAGDIWFRSDLSRTQTVDTLELSAEIEALPNVIGFGNLHNLDQAMARDPQLQALVEQFVTETDDSARRAMLDSIIYQWAGVAEVDPYSRDPSKVYGHVMDARQLETLEALVGREYLGTWCWGERDPNPHGRAAPVLIAEYQAFAGFVYAQLMAQSHFSEAFDQIGIRFDVERLQFLPDMSGLITHLTQMIESGDLSQALAISETLQGLGTYSTVYQEASVEVQSAPSLISYLATNLIEGSDAADLLSGTSGADLLVGHQGDDQLMGGQGQDSYLFNLGDGADRIYDSAGADRILFGEGITQDNLRFSRTATALIIGLVDVKGDATGDQIQIDNVFDFDGSVSEGAIETLHFSDGSELTLQQYRLLIEQSVTEGADTLYGTDQADNFDAGTGDDQLYGGAGDDTYLFSRGDGADLIFEHSGQDWIQFDASISPSQLLLMRSGEQGSDLRIQVLDPSGLPTSDSITIVNAYEGFAASNNQIETLLFEHADGTQTEISLLDLPRSFAHSDQSDLSFGFESDDLMQTGSGADTLHGAGGDDALYGEGDDDLLFGEAGDDHLYGGAGNDQLSGGSGDDTYYFSLLDGHDLIDNRDAGGFDVLQFDSSISARKVALHRVGDDLFIDIDRNTASVLLANYFDGDRVSGSAISEIRFADGKVLGIDEVVSLSMQASQGDDYLSGFETNDLIEAMAGDDSLYGGRGDDRLFGQQGNDRLFGENGDDLLDGGQGEDQLFGGQGDDRLLGGNQSDQLYGSSGADYLHGGRSGDQLYGGSQSDQLFGAQGKDRLYGEQGDDYLAGGEGKDLLVGGAGDDQLEGGLGDDTYLYRRGDGQDQILHSRESEGLDTLEIEGFATDEVWLSQQDDDLIVSFVGEQGHILVEDWAKDPASLDQLEIDGQIASVADMQRLVEAMALFDRPSGAAAEIPLQVKEELQPVLAASWHQAPA